MIRSCSVVYRQTVKKRLKQARVAAQLSGGIRTRGRQGVGRDATVLHLPSDNVDLVLAGQGAALRLGAANSEAENSMAPPRCSSPIGTASALSMADRAVR